MNPPNRPTLRRFAAPFGFALACVGLLALAGCGAKPNSADHVAQKPFRRILDASQIKLLDVKLRSGRIELRQTDRPELQFEGEIRVHSGDARASQARASGVEFLIKDGRFTRVELPDPEGEFSYEAILTVWLPATMNLNITLGSGSIRGDIALPLRTDLQVGAGKIELAAPPASSVKINAQVNIGSSDPAILVEGFDNVVGSAERQLTRWSFEGWIGLPSAISGLIDVRVNEGSFTLKSNSSAPQN